MTDDKNDAQDGNLDIGRIQATARAMFEVSDERRSWTELKDTMRSEHAGAGSNYSHVTAALDLCHERRSRVELEVLQLRVERRGVSSMAGGNGARRHQTMDRGPRVE